MPARTSWTLDMMLMPRQGATKTGERPKHPIIYTTLKPLEMDKLWLYPTESEQELVMIMEPLHTERALPTGALYLITTTCREARVYPMPLRKAIPSLLWTEPQAERTYWRMMGLARYGQLWTRTAQLYAVKATAVLERIGTGFGPGLGTVLRLSNTRGGDSDDEDICVCRENKCFCIKPRNMLAY